MAAPEAVPESDAVAGPPRAVGGASGLRRGFVIGGRLLAGGVFVAAGALKISDPAAFARNVIDYHLVPEAIVPAIAVFLPWCEVVAGALVVAGFARRGGLAVLTALAGLFLAVQGVTLVRGLSPSCACFGPLGGRVGPMSVLIDLCLLALCAALVREERRRAKGSPAAKSA